MTGHFSEESLAEVSQLFSEMDWAKQFRTGKGPGPEKKDNYDTGLTQAKAPASWKAGKGKGNMGKMKEESGMLSPVAYPKQKANWGNPPSKEVFGMRALG